MNRVFHNFDVIRWIQQNEMCKKMKDSAKHWTQVVWLAVIHSNHYTRKFSVLVWDCKWILIHVWVILANSTNSSDNFEKDWTSESERISLFGLAYFIPLLHYSSGICIEILTWIQWPQLNAQEVLSIVVYLKYNKVRMKKYTNQWICWLLMSQQKLSKVLNTREYIWVMEPTAWIRQTRFVIWRPLLGS